MRLILTIVTVVTILAGLGLIAAVWIRHHIAWYRTFPWRMRRAMVQAGLVRRLPGRPDEKPKLVRKNRDGDIWKLAWKVPVGVTSEGVLAKRAAIEEHLDCSLDCWPDGGLLHMRVGTARIPELHLLADAGSPRLDGALVVHLGMSREGQLDADLTRPPHTLIGGTSGQGKSALVQSLVLQAAQRYTPQQVQVVLTDLKGAVDLSIYDGLPHLRCPIIGRTLDAAAELTDVVAEQVRRQDMLRAIHCPNIAEWNRLHAQSEQRLPYILVVIDEFAELLPKGAKGQARDERQAAWDAVSEITRMGRASGVHAIIATQRPDADVIDPQTRANCGRVIATLCATKFNSEVLLGPGNTAAWRLADREGLAIHRRGNRETMVQLAYTPAAEIEAVVQGLRLRYGLRPGLPAVAPVAVLPNGELVP